MYLISVVLFIFIAFLQAGVFGGGGMKLTYLVDYPSLFLILLLTLPIMMAAGLLKDFFHAFSMVIHRDLQYRKTPRRETEYTQEEMERALIAVKLAMKMFLGAGGLLCVMSMVAILRQLDDPAALGPNITVALLALLYGLILDSLLLPLAARIQTMILAPGGPGEPSLRRESSLRERSLGEEKSLAGREVPAMERDRADKQDPARRED